MWLKHKAEHWVPHRNCIWKPGCVETHVGPDGLEQEVSELQQEMEVRGPRQTHGSDVWLCLQSHTPQQSHGWQTPTAEVPFSNQTAISFDYSSISRPFSTETISIWECIEHRLFLSLWNNCKTSLPSLAVRKGTYPAELAEGCSAGCCPAWNISLSRSLSAQGTTETWSRRTGSRGMRHGCVCWDCPTCKIKMHLRFCRCILNCQ